MMNNILKNSEDRLNEILFQGRNKEYGAYALRSESNSILTKSMLIGVSFLVAIAATPLVINSFKEKIVTDRPVLHPSIYITEDPPAETVKPIEKQQQQVQKPVKTYDDRVPNPRKDADETKLVKDKDKVDAAAGIQTNDGDKVDDPNKVITTTKTSPEATDKKGGDDVVTKPVDKPIIDKEIVQPKVDVNANFIGGIDAFRNKVLNAVDGSGIGDGGETIKTEVTFVVERDGTISNIKANGKDATFNKEAIRAIKSVRGKWKPAEIKGETVRSFFKFPLVMKFD